MRREVCGAPHSFEERRRPLGAMVSAVLLLAICGICALASAPALADLPPGGLAPAPRLSDGAVVWSPVGVESSYRVAISTAPGGDPIRMTTYVTVPRSSKVPQSYRPYVSRGQTVYVGVSADGGVVWSDPEVAVSSEAVEGRTQGTGAPPQPAGGNGEGNATETGEGTETGEAAPGPSIAASVVGGANAALPARRLIGTVDGAGWGPGPARTILGGHITWDRVAFEKAGSPEAKISLEDGFKVLAVVNPVNDSTPLSRILPKRWGATAAHQLALNPGVSIAEAGNESYLKGGVADPAQYGRMYLSALASMKALGIHVPLLFNMTGDYPHGTWWTNPQGWSEDAHGGGWLRDAVNANPGLAAAILANGISIHPYGALGENVRDGFGVNAAAADEAVAKAVLGSIPPFYITEFGYDLALCGSRIGACSQQEQASKLRAAYTVFLTDPHVMGIFWYQSHDDSTGHFGYMNTDGSTRPSFSALSAIAAAAGQ